MTDLSTTLAAAPAVIDGYFADPDLVVEEGRFHLYPTTDGSEGWQSDSFRVFSSDDLATWESHGEIFSVTRDTSWAHGHAWAPAVLGREGRFYLYFSADDNIGVAVADSPTGPFVDSGRPLVAAGAYDGTAIDPSVFTDDGTVYLLWGNRVAHIVPLGDDLVSFDPAAVVSFRPTGFREAAQLHRRLDTYYLSWSENDTREPDYRVRYATAPSPYGPWTDRGILLEKHLGIGVLATGHHSVLRVPGTDDWLIAYHRFAIPGGDGHHREVVVQRLHHRPDGLLAPVLPAAAGSRLRVPLPSTAGSSSPSRTTTITIER